MVHLELIGLVVRDVPVVYLSHHLPRMDDLTKTPTRPLDAFEAEALEQLRGGEDLFYRGNESQGRMVGSVRAVKQCLDCHGGSRGDLLGAFSYRLKRQSASR